MKHWNQARRNWYLRVLALQRGRCAICKTADPGGGEHVTRLVIDHDHRCCPDRKKAGCEQCRRGLLCVACNTMLGQAGDDPARLEAGAAYLRRHHRPRKESA